MIERRKQAIACSGHMYTREIRGCVVIFGGYGKFWIKNLFATTQDAEKAYDALPEDTSYFHIGRRIDSQWD